MAAAVAAAAAMMASGRNILCEEEYLEMSQMHGRKEVILMGAKCFKPHEKMEETFVYIVLIIPWITLVFPFDIDFR